MEIVNSEEKELKQLELSENQDMVFNVIEEKKCGNCEKFKSGCGMLKYLNDRIDYVNIYNGAVGRDEEIPHYDENWVCGTHSWVKRGVENESQSS